MEALDDFTERNNFALLLMVIIAALTDECIWNRTILRYANLFAFMFCVQA
jgi:hypothetical protein